MSNIYYVTIDAVVTADSFEEAVRKYDASDYYIDSHSFDSPIGGSFDEQELYVRDRWEDKQPIDWTEIKDPDGEDYK
jgi:hypothetical protein